MSEAESQTPDYRDLQDQVGRMLPADAHGRRRPADHDAVRVYWEVGRLLNERLQGRAEYGRRALAQLADDLGVLPRTLYRARKLHQRLPHAHPALGQLTWSHCRLLVTVDDDDELLRLMARAADEGWSVRRLQEHLRQAALSAAPAPPRPRPGIYQVVAAEGGSGIELDLGFGLRRPASALGRVGKRTRRLLAELAAGDVVELVRDGKDRPKLRRMWGQVTARLYTYPARLLRVETSGVVTASLRLGFDLRIEQRLGLRGPAGTLSADHLQSRLAAAPEVVVAKTHRLDHGAAYEADLYALPGEGDVAAISERGEYLNEAWGGP